MKNNHIIVSLLIFASSFSFSNVNKDALSHLKSVVIPTQPNWVYIPANNKETAIKLQNFYLQLFGWKITQTQHNENHFWIGTKRKRFGALLADRRASSNDEGIKLQYEVSNHDEVYKRAIELGARPIQPPYNFLNTRLSEFADPAGNMIGLITRLN